MMSNKIKITLIIIIGIGIYTLGCIMPLQYLRFDFDDTEISRAEYVKIIISIIAAIGTFSAVTVALFKEKIWSSLNKPKLEFSKPKIKPIFEHISGQKTLKPGEVLAASKYSSRLIIKNTGNVTATNVELILEKIEYSSLNSEIEEFFEPPGDNITWGNGKEAINILPGSEKVITIVDVIAPRQSGTPDANDEKELAEIIIGNFNECPKKTVAGVWKASFVLYAQNHKHIQIKIRIEWKGKWRDRLTDFEPEYEYKFID